VRRGITLIVSIMVVAALGSGIAGCVSAPPSRADQGLVWGFVSSAENAQLVVDPQNSSVLGVSLSRVVAPEDAWVCVYLNDGGVVGKMVGQVRVKQGATDNVAIPLDPGTSGKVFVLMHVDRGKSGVFEFDEQNKDESPDRPVFVDGKELSEPLTLRAYGAAVPAGSARIAVYRQGSITATLTVGDVVAPGPSWLVVQASQDGRPGKVLSFAPIAAGRFVDLPVTLTSGPPQDNFFVTLFADSGVAGRFEFDPKSPLTSADQPYYVGNAPVTSEVPVTKK
jgi:hypothetical protein